MVSAVQKKDGANDAHERHVGIPTGDPFVESGADAAAAMVAGGSLCAAGVGTGSSADTKLVEKQNR